MPPIQLRLISSITQLPNKPFMHLYLKLIVLVKKYVAITNSESLLGAYKKMQNEEERVKQLDVELNAPSETVKKKNEVHKSIKKTIRSINYSVKAYEQWYLQSYRANAAYISNKLAGLFDLKRMTSMADTATITDKIKYTIENDTKLANALMEVKLMNSVEMLYKQGEEYRQLYLQETIDKNNTKAINKTAIRKEAANALRFLFVTIKVNYGLTNDEVWVEMADEVRELVGEATDK